MKTYPEYGPATEPWFPDTPAHWAAAPIWTLFTRESRRGYGEETLLSVYREHGVVPRYSRDDNNNRASEDLSSYQLVEPGDLVVNKMKAWQGSLSISNFRGIVSPAYFVYRPHHHADARFLHHLLRAQPLIAAYMGNSKGVRINQWDLEPQSFSRLKLVLPPLGEQRAIADFLDRETARIDTLIEEQQRLVEMLRERREVEIRHTLLAGVDEAPTKSSGVALLGEIPRHWHMVPARYLCTITTGSEDSGNASEDGQYPFYVRGREILSIDRYSFDGEAVMTPGDGQGGTGKVFHYFDGKFEAHQRVYVFKDFDGVTGPFFYYFLSTFLRPVALAGSNTVTMESLRRPLLADFKVAVPPIDEQRRITEYLDEQTAKLDELVAQTECFIELSRERRAALITAAVTGQIDVREVA